MQDLISALKSGRIAEQTKEVTIDIREQDVVFKIRALTSKEISDIESTGVSMKVDKNQTIMMEEKSTSNEIKKATKYILEGVVEPNLRSKEFLNNFDGITTGEQFISEYFSFGNIISLGSAVTSFSNTLVGGVDRSQAIKEIKN